MEIMAKTATQSVQGLVAKVKLGYSSKWLIWLVCGSPCLVIIIFFVKMTFKMRTLISPNVLVHLTIRTLKIMTNTDTGLMSHSHHIMLHNLVGAWRYLQILAKECNTIKPHHSKNNTHTVNLYTNNRPLASKIDKHTNQSSFRPPIDPYMTKST